MKNMTTPRFAALAVAVALLMTPIAVAQEEAKGFPDQGGLHIVPAAAFYGDGWLAEGSYFFSFSQGLMHGNTAGSYGCMMAPALLPDINANVYQFFTSLYDNDPSYNMYVTLWRMQIYTGVAQSMANVSTTTESTSIQTPGDLSVNYPDVVYPSYQYYITTCASHYDVGIYNARLWYRIDHIFSDGFESGNYLGWDVAVP